MVNAIESRLCLSPKKSDINVINNGLCAFNQTYLINIKTSSMALFVDDSGKVIGGLTASVVGCVLHLDYLWLPKRLRSQALGRRLVDELEDFALSRELSSICLDTYSFQAPLFYQLLGFNEVGRFKQYLTKGVDKIFYQKELMSNSCVK